MKTLLNQAVKTLEKAGVETPKLDAEVLLAHALGCERHELYTKNITGCQAPGDDFEKFRTYIQRRCKREPVAYIRGFKEFWSLKIKVTPAVLIPRPETETLVEKVVEILRPSTGLRASGNRSGHGESSIPGHGEPVEPCTILDLCTGSGCIAAALATELPDAQITVADISKEALDVARENLAFAKERITFIQSNLFEKIPPPSTGKFDLIVSNPPYIPSTQITQLFPEVSRYEPRLALDGGPDGLAFIDKIKQTAPNFLNPNGWLVLEAGSEIFIWTNSSSKGE